MVKLGAGAERRPRVERQVEGQPVTDDRDVTVGQLGQGPLLAGEVEAVGQEGDGREHEPRIHAGSGRDRIGLVAVVQRRSSRCLHDMHSVACGTAINRFLPTGLPQESQTP